MVRWESPHIIPTVKLCMHTKFRSVATCIFLAGYHFWLLLNIGRGVSI